MLRSIFGLYSVLIASTRVSYGHDRGVLEVTKMGSNFRTILGLKKLNWIPTYAFYSGCFTLVSFSSSPPIFWAQIDVSMMASTPMSLSPHTKWIHLCCDDYLDFHIIGYACVVGIDKNQRLWREIIPTIRGLKSSYFTQFTSNLAMLRMLHCIIHTYFTHDI